MKKTILLFIMISGMVSAQPGNYLDFLPLQVGNIWVYQCTANGTQCGYCTKRIKVSMMNSSVINGKTYYQSQVMSVYISGSCISCGGGPLPFDYNIRVDSVSANVLMYTTSGGCSNTPNEILQDSLKARLNDTIRYGCQPPTQWDWYTCIDTNNVTIFGVSRQCRSYYYHAFEAGWGRSYVKGIGSPGSSFITMGCNSQTQLLGCVIGGVVYGDTSLTGINKISGEVPKEFSLSQNCPNPFNPVTKIQFSLPSSAEGGTEEVKLIIYDILGHEIQTLVNEKLSPGTYEVEFDGTNFSSGVYYYKLISGEFIQTRKMVLIK